MQRLEPQRSKQAQPVDIECLLKARYSQQMAWAQSLTRGDVGKAQDIVQELCLYFTLKRPDLSEVENVEGYLYTCLRHIYLSSLARASREASHFISIVDFDSFDFAMTSKRSGDPLERQNDLRRICNFSIWRKEKSKSASYFILHFFHGYSRQETAELVRLPISAIYNKLKIARLEIKSHLEDSNKLRIANREVPPPAPRSWTLLSAPDLFKELRDAILGARQRKCLHEQQLLAYYAARQPEPIPCPLLSHIVSCERCLDLIDRHFQRPGLADREPLDSIGFAGDGPVSKPKDDPEIHAFKLLKRRWKQVYEHRPNTLSIAHNGKIIASHDVVSSQSTLSARILDPGRDPFIEVFSEQDVRLALLSIEDMPPDGPARLEQSVQLSDSRWLELLVTFDGLGLHSQVTYHDEALALDNMFATSYETDAESQSPVAIPQVMAEAPPQASLITVYGQITRVLRALTPAPVLAWALTLLLFVGGAGYLLLRHQNRLLDVTTVLDQSIKVEAVASQGATEHQFLRVEEITANGGTKERGTIELWKDSDGSRYIRCLYDTKHRLVAAKWHNKSGTHSHVEEKQKRSNDQNELLAADVWQHELSAVEFRRLGGQESFVATANGYELTTALPAKENSHLVSATLVLDKSFRPFQQTFEVRDGKRILRLRLIQVSLERTASTSVPDSKFDLADPTAGSSASFRSPSGPQSSAQLDRIGARVAVLQIATLYQLYELGADVGQPIDVARTSDGRLRISGSVADSTLKQQIVARLNKLESSELLDLQINEPANAETRHTNQVQSSNTLIYEIGEARPLIEPSLRAYLSSKNNSEEKLKSTMEQYSRHVLLLSQRALQDAYALHRLGSVFSTSDVGSLDLASRRRWTVMVDRHSTDLNSELDSLSEQLVPLDPEFHNSSSLQASPIENGDQFFQVTDELLDQMQEVNQVLGILFTANATPTIQGTSHALLERGLSAMPLHQGVEIGRFASKLKASDKAQSRTSTADESIRQAPEH